MAKLKIIRNMSRYGAFYPVNVLVNGEKNGSIVNGGVLTVEVPEGTHSIKCRSIFHNGNNVNFSILENEIKIFNINPVESNVRIMYIPYFAIIFIFILFKSGIIPKDVAWPLIVLLFIVLLRLIFNKKEFWITTES